MSVSRIQIGKSAPSIVSKSISKTTSNRTTSSSASKTKSQSKASKTMPKASGQSKASKAMSKTSNNNSVSKAIPKIKSQGNLSKATLKVSSSSKEVTTSIKLQSRSNSKKALISNSVIKSLPNANNKLSVVVKGISTGIMNKPLKDTSFFIKTNTSEATKINILMKAKNSVKPKWIFRIDGAHKAPPKPMYPHINTNSTIYPNNKIYQSLNHKPISNVTYNIAKNYDKIANYAKVGGRALATVAIALDVNDIFNSFQSDGNSIGRNTVVTTASVAGGWVGGIGGAKAGAVGGATIGTMICPGIGTLVGGTIGGIVGGIFGSFLGKEGGKAIVNQISR